MNAPTEIVLEKVANELEAYADVVDAENIIIKMAFAVKSLKLIKEKEEVEKTAAINENIANVGGTLAKALVAGIGLGLAGEVIGAGHEKVKKMLFESKLNTLANQVKKVNPELKSTNTEDIKRLLRAGYTLAPDIIQNPTLAASFVSIGNSLGGKIDPNTMKTFAEAQSKAKGNKNPILEALPNAGSVL